MICDLNSLRGASHQALLRVARGQIVSEDGTMRHRSDVLPPDTITLLQALRRHGLIVPASPDSDRSTVELTLVGAQLLDRWNRQHGTDTPASISATADDTVDGSVARGPSS